MFAVMGVQAQIQKGYYTITNNGKYINVLGRKTVGFASDNTSLPGTVYLIQADQLKSKNVGEGEADDYEVTTLRSQGVDLPGYARRAMNYVPEIIELVVDKLQLEGGGELFGTTGVDAIYVKFKEGFDYNLYLDPLGNNQYRIYGKTPSMKHVVDFYKDNTDKVKAKLPMLEAKINEVIRKILEKTHGSGASILVPYSIHYVWEQMKTKYPSLLEPVEGDDNAILAFYDQVLQDENMVWDFAYESVMIYWDNLIQKLEEKGYLDALGEYSQYLDKVKNVRPDFRYYIVAKGNSVDFISQGNPNVEEDCAKWTVQTIDDFTLNFNEENVKNGGTEFYTTFYADFGYSIGEGGKAFKVTEVDQDGYAVLEEVKDIIPAQTPILLMTTNANHQLNLTLKTESGSTLTGNILLGNDYLVNQYELKAEQAVALFAAIAKVLPEDLYNRYVKEYEYLMLKNSGTVNNKYFFGLSGGELKDVSNIRVLSMGNQGDLLAFHDDWSKLNANEAFIEDDNKPVKLTRVPDINRDGIISVLDLTALIDIIVQKDFVAPFALDYDHDAADVNGSGGVPDSMDVTSLIDILIELSQNNNQ